MKIKMIVFGVLASATISGSALAGALDEPAMMAPFYTDSSMTTMKSEADLKAAWTAMSKTDQDAMQADCKDTSVAAKHTEFCSTMGRLWGNS